MINTAEHEIFPAHKCQNASNVNGQKNSIIGLSEPENS